MILSICLLYHSAAFTQVYNRDRIRDSVIGWWPENRYDKLKPGTDAVSRQRTQAVNLIADWVKKSYTPVGGLGSYQRWIVPTAFGVAFDVWDVRDKPDANGRYQPEGETNITFRIEANRLPGAYAIGFMNKPGQDFYFVWQPDGYADTKQFLDKRQGTDPRISKNAYPYLTRINEWHSVILAPGNQLPVTPVTVEELLQQAEISLAGELETAGEKTIDKYRDNIRQLRKKHAGILQQQAVISAMQPTMYSFETDPDIFDTNNWAGQQALKHYYPVYKLTAAVLEKCKAAQPQWLAIYFPFKTQADGNKNVEIYRSLTENLNYSYIYNYFFDPAKVKGTPYTPVDAAGWTARLEEYRNKDKKQGAITAAKQLAQPAGTLLYDDFSKDAPGSKPAGWQISDRDHLSAVIALKDQTGHWLRLQYNSLIKPTNTSLLPKDFLLELDFVTDDFEGQTGGRLQLNLLGSTRRTGGVTASSDFLLELTAGKAQAARENHNYRGEVRIKLNNYPTTMPYNDQGGEINMAQQVFTDEKKKVHVTVRKEGANIQVMLNGSELVRSTGLKTRYGNKPCGDCTIPSDIIYSKLSFKNMTQDDSKVNAYISNIKITRL